MMNSRALQAKLTHGNSRVKTLAESKLTAEEIVTELYLATFGRLPTPDELAKAVAAYDHDTATRRTATEDLMWALINTPEFVFND